MNLEQAELLRRICLKDKRAIDSVMAGDTENSTTLDARCGSLVRIAALLSIDSDPSTFEWAVDQGIATGVDDDSIVDTIKVVAPIIGVAKLTSTLPRLMAALHLEIIED